MRLPFRRRRRARPSGRPMYQVTEVIGSSAANLDEAIEVAAQRLAQRQSTDRPSRGVGLPALALLGMVAAGAYAAGRALLERDTRNIEEMLGPLGPAATSLADELRAARTKVRAGIVESRRAADEARRELEAEYLQRTGRDPDAS